MSCAGKVSKITRYYITLILKEKREIIRRYLMKHEKNKASRCWYWEKCSLLKRNSEFEKENPQKSVGL